MTDGVRIQAGVTDKLGARDKRWRAWQTMSDEAGGWRGVLCICWRIKYEVEKTDD